MIGYIQGTILEHLPTQVLVDVQGVGYEILIPLSAAADSSMETGKPISLFTHLAVREDAHVLYGFSSRQQRDLFRTLISSVSGIGPKIALNILSGMPVDRFRNAVAQEDAAALSSIPGIGKKTAERMIVELRDKIGILQPQRQNAPAVLETAESADPIDQAVRALVALQIKPVDAISMVEKAARKLGNEATTENLVRACLQKS